MRSRINLDNRACYQALPKEVRKQARSDFKIWKRDPYHTSLHFKVVVSQHKIWSVRAGINYRAVGKKLDTDLMIWFWIGSHADYDRIISQAQRASVSKQRQVSDR